MELDFTEGCSSTRLHLPHFVTDADRQETVLEDAQVLLHQGKISAVADILPLLEKVVEGGKPLFIIAEDIDGEALSTLVVNKIRGTFKGAAVKAPAFGDRRKAMLQDIAVLTGAQVVTSDLGLDLKTVGTEVLGQAGRVVITRLTHRGAPVTTRPWTIASRRSAPRSRTPIPTGIARSSRSASRSWPAASP